MSTWRAGRQEDVMSHLALFFLGPPRIERDGVPVHLSRRKAVALIAYLAVTGQSHRRDVLATLLWPDYDQSRARAGLRRVLATLKDALGEGWLDVQGEEVGLRQEAGIWLDVRAFRDRLAECRVHGHPPEEVCAACLPLLAGAAALYRGTFLAGFTLRDSLAFDEWQLFHSQGLHDELDGALERLAHGYGARGEFEEAIAYARRWLALDPLHEAAHCCLMRLYARSGQRAAALRQYAECARVLQEELGVSPGAETAELGRRIKEGNEQLAPAARTSPAGAHAPARKHNLPAQLTPFVGRKAALSEIAAYLEDPGCRLLTLMGPGGSGKTRLVLEVASRQIDRFAHGVFLASLAPLQSAEGIVPTVAQALGLSFGREGDPRQQLIAWLAPRNVLLILDNLEHLLPIPGQEGYAEPGRESAAGVVTGILQGAPEVKILATSRARLGVQGEHLFPVTGMEIPDEREADAIQYGAVQLFLTGARRSWPRFEPAAGDLAHVVRICHLVEGLPLGILLAAAWMEMLTPAEIAAEIESQVPGRGLDFLAADWHDVPGRQRSMRAVFDHSWRMLNRREQEVFAALSVFQGGFTREAARQVAGASLHELMALVEKSMLQRLAIPLPPPGLPAGSPPPEGAPPRLAALRMAGAAALGPEGRYEIHGLLRQYAAQRLAAAQPVEPAGDGRSMHDRHCAYYLAALQQWAAGLKGARQQAALAEIEADLGNVRAAWDRAVEQGQVERLAPAMEGLGLFHDWRVRYEEAEVTFRAAAERLAVPESELPAASAARLRAWAGALAWHAHFCRLLGHTGQARDRLQQSLDLLDGPLLAGQDTRPDRAFLLHVAGELAYWSGDRQEARQVFARSLALYRALGDRWGVARALCASGMAAQGLGACEEARRLHEESLAIRRTLGDQRGAADTLLWLAFVLQDQGELKEAERLERESMAISQGLGDRDTLARGLFCLAFTLSLQGRYAEARQPAEECAAIGAPGSRAQMDNVLAVLGVVEMSVPSPRAGKGSRYGPARTWMQMGLAQNREMDDRWGIGYALLSLGELALAERKEVEALQRLQESVDVFREGQHRGAMASALAVLGSAAQLQGDPCRAQRCLCEALRTLAEIRSFAWLLPALPAAALVLAGQGEAERAVEVYALASRHPYVANARYVQDIAGQRIAAAAAALPPGVADCAQERGRARDLWATAEELVAGWSAPSPRVRGEADDAQAGALAAPR
jgi:DNA-binding SARP family transcriptional activator/predicted ATPase